MALITKSVARWVFLIVRHYSVCLWQRLDDTMIKTYDCNSTPFSMTLTLQNYVIKINKNCLFSRNQLVLRLYFTDMQYFRLLQLHFNCLIVYFSFDKWVYQLRFLCNFCIANTSNFLIVFRHCIRQFYQNVNRGMSSIRILWSIWLITFIMIFGQQKN